VDGWDWVQQNQDHPPHCTGVNRIIIGIWISYWVVWSHLNPNLRVKPNIQFLWADGLCTMVGSDVYATEFELERMSSRNRGLFETGKALFGIRMKSIFLLLKEPAIIYTGLLWQWPTSAYAPYPGYKTTNTALGEITVRFMAKPIVLKGAMCATPKSYAARFLEFLPTWWIAEAFTRYFVSEGFVLNDLFRSGFNFEIKTARCLSKRQFAFEC